MLTSRAHKRIAGLVMIGVLAVVLVLAATTPNPFASHQTIYAEFENVNGLGSIDRDIRVAGVNEGTIGEVERVGDDALVELQVDDEIVVHDDAQVTLRPHTLFEGSAFVDLHPGSPSAPTISDGATIPRRQTRVYVSLDEALRVLREPVREAFRDLVRVGSEATGGGAPAALQKTLKAAPGLTEELGPTARALQGPQGDALARAIAGASRTVEALALRESSLVPLAQRANATLRALDVDGAVPLERAFAALPGPLETLRDRGGQITTLIEQVDALAVELRPALEEFAPALSGFRPIVERATPAVRRALPLVSAIGAVLRRATAAAPVFERLLGILGPAQAIQEERVLPELHKETRLGLPGYMQLIAAFAGGNAALSTYQTEAQGLLGRGHAIRLGAYFDPAGTLGSIRRLPCTLIGALNEELATALEEAGLCS
jgi:virulence factor Mce-like protein